jgi:hypothetical protein
MNQKRTATLKRVRFKAMLYRGCMKNKTVILKVTYTYNVTYGHEDHLADIKRDLEKDPIHELCGASVASDGNVHSYSCERKGKGVVAV